MIQVDKSGKKNTKLYMTYVVVTLILTLSLTIAFIAFYNPGYKVQKTATTSTGQDIVSGNYTARTASTFRQPMAVGTAPGYEANIGVFDQQNNNTPIQYNHVATQESQSVLVVWSTDKNTNATLNWGITPALGNVLTQSTYSTLHSLNITGLEALTTYYYSISNCDFDELCTTNGTFNITTLPTPEYDPPVITNIVSGNATNQTIIIYFETNESATTKIDFGITESLGSSTINTTLVLNHAIIVSGLINNTLYFYNITSCDTYHNCNTTGTYNFSTLQTDDFPVITLINPLDNHISTVRTITFECSATDDEGGLQNLTLYTNITGWKAENTTNQSYISYTATRIKNGEYRWGCEATDNASQTGRLNNTLIMNSTAVQIVNTNIWRKAVINSTNVTLGMNITNGNYSKIIIINPDGINETFDTTDQNSTVSIVYTNISQVGRYNVTFYANDTIEEDTIHDYFVSASAVTINVSVIDELNQTRGTTIIVYYAGSEIRYELVTNGSYNEDLPDILIDLLLKTDFGGFELFFESISLSKIVQKIFVVDKPLQPEYLATYIINDENFNFSTFKLKIYYTSLPYYNEDALQMYRCANFTFSENRCESTWYNISTIINKAAKYLVANLSGFSAYALKQETFCGDTRKNSNEECEGAEFGGKTCSDYKNSEGAQFTAGTLTCAQDCKITTTGCYIRVIPGSGGGTTSQCSLSESPICYHNKVKVCVEKAGRNVYEFQECTGKAQCVNGVCQACKEDWQCQEWRECFAGIVDRICTDQNDCGTENEKPKTTKTCEQEQREVGKEAAAMLANITPTIKPEDNVSTLPEQERPPEKELRTGGQVLGQKVKKTIEELPLNILISTLMVVVLVLLIADFFSGGKKKKIYLRTQEDYSLTRDVKKKVNRSRKRKK